MKANWMVAMIVTAVFSMTLLAPGQVKGAERDTGRIELNERFGIERVRNGRLTKGGGTMFGVTWGLSVIMSIAFANADSFSYTLSQEEEAMFDDAAARLWIPVAGPLLAGISADGHDEGMLAMGIVGSCIETAGLVMMIAGLVGKKKRVYTHVNLGKGDDDSPGISWSVAPMAGQAQGMSFTLAW